MNKSKNPRYKIKQKEERTLTNRSGGTEEKKLTTYKYKTISEPDYVKQYIGMIDLLKGLTITQKEMIDEMKRYIEYDNVVRLDFTDKKKICKKIGIKLHSFYNSISILRNKDILIILSSAKYFINPFIYARGQHSEILETQKRYTECELNLNKTRQ